MPQVGFARIGWSCFAGALGAFVISSPPSYTPFAGWLGLVFNSIGQGGMLLVIAYAGEAIRVRCHLELPLSLYAGLELGWACVAASVLIRLKHTF